MDSSPQVAVGAVVVRGGHLLLVRRAYPPAAGRWSLPGGRVRAGEPLATATLRELAEETGLRGRVEGLCGLSEHIAEGRHYVIIDYWVALCDADAHAPGHAADDAAELRWMGSDELARRPLVAGLRAWLDAHSVLSRLQP